MAFHLNLNSTQNVFHFARLVDERNKPIFYLCVRVFF